MNYANDGVPIAILRQYVPVMMDRKGLTYAELAGKLNTTDGNLHHAINRGKPDTFLRHLARILHELDISREDFEEGALVDLCGSAPGIVHCLEIGATQTLWFNAYGTGRAADDMRPEEFEISLDLSRSVAVDKKLQREVQRTLDECEAGQHEFSNDKLLHIMEAKWLPPIQERIRLRAILSPHEYALFYTLAATERGPALLHERLRAWRRGEIMPALSGGFGINVALVTSDSQFFLGQRANVQGPRRGQLDIGAAEGFSIEADLSNHDPPIDIKSGARFDVVSAAVRALEEEYGSLAQELSELNLLGFGYDLEYGQWNVLALARLTKPASLIAQRHKRAKHGHEMRKVFAVPAKPKPLFEALEKAERPVWSCGLALAYLSMIRLHGDEPVEKVVAGMNLRPLRNPDA